jgi:hypothetical protein
VSWSEVGGGEGGFFSQVEFGVGSGLFMLSFFLVICFVGVERGSKQRVPSITSLLSHMHWKMLSSFHL